MSKPRSILAGLALSATALATLTFFAAPAMAASEPAQIARAVDGDIMWFDATVGEGDASRIVTKIYAPSASGKGRSLWQRCSFNSTGAGTYRCGIDVAAGSLAAERKGTWMVRVVVDGTTLAQSSFRP